jgi:hypothetical protein
MQNATARVRAIEPKRQLQPVRTADAEARTQPPTVYAPALAVWRLARPSRTNPLPRELARQAISHYTAPGDLVIAPGRRRGELLEQAARLGRRALPLEVTAANARTATGTQVAETVVALRADQGAQLVLALIRISRCERRLAALLPLLRPGGFLLLASAHAADAHRSDGLGSIVRAAQRCGLQYWQHVVALTPGAGDGHEPAAQSQPVDTQAPGQNGARAVRCHHDLLVFRRPAQSDAAVAAAAVAGAAA